MSRKFPLYNSLKKVSNNIDVTQNYKWSEIRNLSENNLEIIFALIYHHNLITSSSVSRKIPYQGKTFQGGGILYMVENLPVELQRILIYYLHDYLRII